MNKPSIPRVAILYPWNEAARLKAAWEQKRLAGSNNTDSNPVPPEVGNPVYVYCLSNFSSPLITIITVHNHVTFK
jgi:hypothetical protein